MSGYVTRHQIECSALDILEELKEGESPTFVKSNWAGEDRLALWEVKGVRVIETNGNSVWEDNEGFAELLAEIEK